MSRLSKELEQIIEGDVGFSIDILKKLKIHNISLEFYIQNQNKISLEESGEEVSFNIKDRILRRNINKVLKKPQKERTNYFSEKEMEEYFYRTGYNGLPLDTRSRVEINRRLEKI